MRSRLLMCICLLVCTTATILGADSTLISSRPVVSPSAASIQGSVGLVLNNPALTGLDLGETCCPRYENPSGVSLLFAAQYSLWHAAGVTIKAVGGIARLGASYTSVEKTIVDLRGDAADAVIDHSLAIQLWNASLGFQLLAPIPYDFNLAVGFNLTVPFHSSFAVSEFLRQPAGVVFETGDAYRNRKNGSITEAATHFTVPLTVYGPAITLHGSFVFRPVAEVQSAVTSLVSSVAWRPVSAALGIQLSRVTHSIEYDTTLIPLPEPIEQPVDTVIPPQSISMSARALDSSMKEMDENESITFSVKRRRLAVLPAVFFDSASTEIPARYLERRDLLERSAQDGLVRDIDVNHAFLAILGRTMQANTSATVKVVACHANDGEPNDREAIAQGRAKSIVDFVCDKYGVDRKRFKVATRALPQRASSSRTVTGRAENRRVEFVLSDAKYELPVQADTILVKSPATIRVRLSTSRPTTITSWSYVARCKGRVIAADSGSGEPPREVLIRLGERQQQWVRQAQSMDMGIVVSDRLDGQVRSERTIYQVAVQPDDQRPFDEFGIVLFDYNSSKVSSDEMSTIQELKARTTQSEDIQITGTADPSGNQEYNLKLAEQRALSVADELQLTPEAYKRQRQISNDYPAELPEGRMLGRQVKVVLRAKK